MIGWDEILYGGLAEGAAVMSWRGNKGGIEAARQGHKVVMPTTNAYLDYTQGDPGLEFPIYASLSFEKVLWFWGCPSGCWFYIGHGGAGQSMDRTHSCFVSRFLYDLSCGSGTFWKSLE